MPVDFRGRDLEHVANAIFSHPLEPGVTNWWWAEELNFEPTEHTQNLAAIFRDPESLQARYSREQLEQGFWYLISGAPGSLEDLIWSAVVPWSVRADLIDSTADLYQKLFAREALDTSVHMFWDALAYGYCVPTRHPDTNADDRRIQDAMFAALQQILEIESIDCRLAALHGLGHLRHPNTEAAITRYLERHPDLTDEYRGYALACIKGEIL
jgi:hypothetical protein